MDGPAAGGPLLTIAYVCVYIRGPPDTFIDFVQIHGAPSRPSRGKGRWWWAEVDVTIFIHKSLVYAFVAHYVTKRRASRHSIKRPNFGASLPRHKLARTLPSYHKLIPGG